MKERPILFSAPMVRALLAGTKTQTRRAVKFQNPGVGHYVSDVVPSLLPNRGDLWDFRRRLDNPMAVRCPYGQPGDRLWVRESWAYNPDFSGIASHACFMADPEHKYDGLKWKPSIHMPRAVCRITLEIVRVRVERLQDISESDALAEGIVQLPDGGFGLPDGSHYHAADPRESYFSLWEAINGPGSVQANPWLWCVEFRRSA